MRGSIRVFRKQGGDVAAAVVGTEALQGRRSRGWSLGASILVSKGTSSSEGQQAVSWGHPRRPCPVSSVGSNTSDFPRAVCRARAAGRAASHHQEGRWFLGTPGMMSPGRRSSRWCVLLEGQPVASGDPRQESTGERCSEARPGCLGTSFGGEK